jgi:hypothetical protein
MAISAPKAIISFFGACSFGLSQVFFPVSVALAQNYAHLSGRCDTLTTQFCDATMPVPAGWAGHVFRLSQSYPSYAPVEDHPWAAFDPKAQPDSYLWSILRYFFEGNLRSDQELSFDPAFNPVRIWYHAPWQSVGLNGREFIHGLTRERVSLPGELHQLQRRTWNNYAVGFYNSIGALTIGMVWKNHGQPDVTAALMPEGTVAAKLLFTTAPVAEVPYLSGAPEWSGFVYSDVNNPTPAPNDSRSIIPLRLLQIDVAVKDSRVADTTGWVFGTFVYGSGPGGTPGGHGWANVAPVGLMWGNQLQESKVNLQVKMPHLGYQGRLNGPVDNPVSSCLSCHSTGQAPQKSLIPAAGQDPALWFRNLRSGQPFTPDGISTDYSLQLSFGISNFRAQQQLLSATPPMLKQIIQNIKEGERLPPRGGGTLD